MHPGQRLQLLAVLIAASIAPAARAGVVYNIHIDSTPVIATTGWLDIQFNPGAVSWQDATATIAGFSSDATLLVSASPLSPDNFGDVSGQLPSTVTFHNTSAFNDYFQRVIFGAAFDFTLALSGDAVDTPAPGYFSGSSLSAAFYADDQATPLMAGPPLFQVDILSGGGIDITNNDPVHVTIDAAGVPEPSTFWLGGCLLAVGASLKRARS